MNGIWQANTREAPLGKSPHGSSYGYITRKEAYQAPGSEQLGASKRWLEEADTTGDAGGTCPVPKPPVIRDWVFVMEKG